MEDKRPRVLLADDHLQLRAALEQLLAVDSVVVGTVSDGGALVSAARDLRPDVVVADISMPVLNGLQAARQIKQSLPDVRFVFLSVHADPEIADEAFRAGGSAYVVKGRAASELRTAVREVMQGRTFITPLLALPPSSGSG